VFKEENSETLKLVAIMSISLTQIRKDYKDSIKTKINLLKKLTQPKTVKYYDRIKTDDHLYIVQEYVEIGSLIHLIKNMGKILESLVAIYIKQVLEGLQYFHS
jgi:serine/threonine protein kinase